MTTTPDREKEFASDRVGRLPRPFILRRMHSILGLWLVLYLFVHLLTNSQAALIGEDDGQGFVNAVNKIHALPYLPIIELVALAFPFLVHGVLGVVYLWSGKFNSFRSDGTKPALPQYKRNKAYTWQRITSWILLVGIIAHVVHMRFVDAPDKEVEGLKTFYTLEVSNDAGLPEIARELDLKLIPEGDRVKVVAPNAGSAFLLLVRDTFKSPLMVILYSILVVAAVYHAFNGLWTWMISWGVTLTRRSQKVMRVITTGLMALVMFLGLMASIGTYLAVRGV